VVAGGGRVVARGAGVGLDIVMVVVMELLMEVFPSNWYRSPVCGLGGGFSKFLLPDFAREAELG
jgi:hypothetical protein